MLTFKTFEGLKYSRIMWKDKNIWKNVENLWDLEDKLSKHKSFVAANALIVFQNGKNLKYVTRRNKFTFISNKYKAL